jgi:hypothetical protein
MCRWGVLIFVALSWATSSQADDTANPHPLSKPPSLLTDPNAELVDKPIQGTKPASQDSENGKLSALSDEANPLTPFYVRTGIGLSFVTSVDYPDFGISGDVPMQPGFATGVMLGAQFHDNIAFEIEGGLLYTRCTKISLRESPPPT